MNIATGSRRTRLFTRHAAAAGLCAALLAVSACSSGDDGGGRGYSVPDRLCGVDVGGETLEPLLPDGEKLAERDSGVAPGSLRCALTVDERPALSVVGDVLNTDADPFADADWYLRLGKDAAPKDGAQYRGTRIMDRFAFTVKECAYQGSARKYAVLVELGESKPVPEDVADRRKALKEFINGFVPSVLKAQGCS
ncbi:hypothetical protein P6B95_18420 [Streptomyces atratus]|uniref:hypothetical protein n=1 Tax=Streptomyces atratus TaxID=1893 RepID=UPI001670A813|nr:hypothetical protein [Streptomyces atratus]WPW29163.1 hypothetical protein P6B95_18420 [Streptomyces atratus]GGT40930.1 hypothetical protein GCM10010207_46350 [Streptomyces atratus]